MLEFYISDETGSKIIYNDETIKPFSSVDFAVDPSTFKANQTVCMTYSNEWSENSCETIVDVENLLVSCQCNMINS